LQKGNYASEFERALANVVSFLEKNGSFLAEFMGSNGEAEIILNHTMQGGWEAADKCFELYLAPAFLGHLSSRGIGLRMQAWQEKVKTKKPIRSSRRPKTNSR
jgi:hypothetical protein